MSCNYVGSRGLINLCDVRSEIPVSDFDGLNPAIYENVSDGMVLHVCPQALNNFVTKVLPKLTKSFVLLTNNSDWTIPDDVMYEYTRLVNHPLLSHWYAQNCIINHQKITRIPIGLDYHSLMPSRKQQFPWSVPERHSWGLKISPILQEEQLLSIKSTSLPFDKRQLKAYANFQFLMTTRYGKIDRVDAYNTIPKDLVFYEPTKCTRDICWKNMIKYSFVISPHGNGLDCHRTWEALCLGCIPIVKTSGLDPLFEDLPVWIVDSWKDVTEENMRNKINEFVRRIFRYEKLTIGFWKSVIRSSN